MASEIPQSLTTEQACLASALQLLIDAAFVREGKRIRYSDVRAFVGNGRLSRSRWAYMLRGDSHLVTSQPILSSLAAFFGVEPEHFTSAGRPDLLRILADDLPAITRHRFSEVRRFAADETTGFDDSALERVVSYLDAELSQLEAVTPAPPSFSFGAPDLDESETAASVAGRGPLANKTCS